MKAQQRTIGEELGVNYKNGGKLSFRDLIAILASGKWWMFLFTAVSVLGALFILFISAPVYEANALLQLEQYPQQNMSVNQVQEMARMVTGGVTPAQAQMQIIRSRSVVGQVVRDLGLNIRASPFYFPVVGAAIARRESTGSEVVEPWFNLRRYAWGGEKIKITRFIIPDSLYGKRFVLLAMGRDRYRLQTKSGRIILTGKVGEVAESAKDGIKVFVQDLIARAGERFNVKKSHWADTAEDLAERLSVNEEGKDSGIIRISLSGTDPKSVEMTLNAIVDAFLRQNVQQKSAQAEQSLTFIEKQLPNLRNQLNDAEARFADYRQKHQAVDLNSEAQAVLKQLIDVEQNIEKLKLKHAANAQLYTNKHPQMVGLQQQIVSLENKKQEIEKKISYLPQKQKKILELKRDVGVRTQIYTNLLNEAQQLKIVKAGTIGTVRIVDHAVKPRHSVGPRRNQTMIIALLLGGLLGICFLVSRKALQRTVTDPNEIEDKLGLPVYAVIPHCSPLAREEVRVKHGDSGKLLLAQRYPYDVATESLRSLRTNLQLGFVESERKIVLITGSRANVGKSFVTTNLGLLVANSGQRVAVVDGDLRAGRLHQYLRQERAPGFSDILAGKASLDFALRIFHEPHSMLLPSGTLFPDPSELLMSRRCSEVFGELSKRFDMVLIDTPPIMDVTDAAILAAHAGVTLMVVRAGINPLPEVEESIKRFKYSKLGITGILFNDFRANMATSSYGYYYR